MSSEARGSKDALEQQRDKLYIPDTITDWPWVRSTNAFEDVVTAGSIAWASRYSYFTHSGWDYQDVLLETCSGAERIKFLCYR